MNATRPVQPVVLFALLDWGMGHATRTSPLIQHAVDCGWDVHVGTKGTALAFLKSQFQGQPITFHDKPGPDITYSKRGTFFKIAGQMPRFLRSIQAETEWTARLVDNHSISHIVSDNCYGVHHPEVPSVMISHQLQLPVPQGLEGFARAFVKRHARKFRAIWIPDDEEARLSGTLATQNPMEHMRFIGALTRLPVDAPPAEWKTVGMVSGPEPHRGLMEKALLAWMKQLDEPALLIAGRPGAEVQSVGNVTIWPDPTAMELAGALSGAHSVVCRSGYSSLLDLAALGKRAVLIPTPGQPEQAYLAKHWNVAFGIATCTQKQLEAGALPEPSGSVPRLEPNRGATQALDELIATA